MSATGEQTTRTSRFAGRTAVVTGAGGNIGSATVQRLAREGARVLAVDRDGTAAERTAASAGSGVQAYTADVTRSAEVAAYAAAAAELGGGEIGLFFNNAGIEGPIAPLDEVDEDAFDAVIAVNVKGTFLGLKHVLPFMRAGAAIVNTASVGALGATPSLGPYVASKHAVLGLTRTAAKEVAARGIRVNAVCPGPVGGRMMESIEQGTGLADARALFTAGIPAGRYATPEDVAAAVSYLLSDDAAYVTGNAHVVDGGMTA
jgi:NAD(P)-dependent dehydrogenase (short-subunit alcohol dehydrogenase family)